LSAFRFQHSRERPSGEPDDKSRIDPVVENLSWKQTFNINRGI
jgi:hypothetical protein